MTPDSSDDTPLKEVTIFTDGAAVPNPGAGGYGVVLRFGKHCRELSGGFLLTTNNRMELMAVIVGLEALKERCKVTLHSDSQYIVDSINSGAVFRWRKNDWTLNPKRTKPVKNVDLWERLLLGYEQHEVEMIWIKGHAGVEDNERCDVLAMAACKRGDLPPDPGFQGTPGAKTAGTGSESRSPQEKIVAEGQPCRKCQTPVIRQTPKKKSLKPNQTYYYAWYLFCPGCQTMYMVEEAKKDVAPGDDRLFEESMGV